MIINNKKELSSLIDENLAKYPIIAKYFTRTIKNLVSTKGLGDLLEIPLVRYVAINYAALENFEKFIEERSFTNVESPLSRLKSDLNEYHAVLSELQVAKMLKDEGMKNIKFIPQSRSNPDIEFSENGATKYAEVKGFMTINPSFPIIHDKFEAESLQNQVFKRTFIVDYEYQLSEFKSIKELHKDLKGAVDKLIKELTPLLKKGEIEDHQVKVGKFVFKVSSKPIKRGEFLLLFSVGGGGENVFYGQPGDVFLQLSSVYTRIISNSRAGYLQLLNKRGGNKDLVKEDRLYLFLNLERFAFFGDDIKPIFNKFTKVLGINEIVNLKLII